jgi:hypothetical protein
VGNRAGSTPALGTKKASEFSEAFFKKKLSH